MTEIPRVWSYATATGWEKQVPSVTGGRGRRSSMQRLLPGFAFAWPKAPTSDLHDFLLAFYYEGGRQMTSGTHTVVTKGCSVGGYESAGRAHTSVEKWGEQAHESSSQRAWHRIRSPHATHMSLRVADVIADLRMTQGDFLLLSLRQLDWRINKRRVRERDVGWLSRTVVDREAHAGEFSLLFFCFFLFSYFYFVINFFCFLF
jgi:hypothetical protein